MKYFLSAICLLLFAFPALADNQAIYNPQTLDYINWGNVRYFNIDTQGATTLTQFQFTNIGIQAPGSYKLCVTDALYSDLCVGTYYEVPLTDGTTIFNTNIDVSNQSSVNLKVWTDDGLITVGDTNNFYVSGSSGCNYSAYGFCPSENIIPTAIIYADVPSPPVNIFGVFTGTVSDIMFGGLVSILSLLGALVSFLILLDLFGRRFTMWFLR